MIGIKEDLAILCCIEPNTPPGWSPYTSPGLIITAEKFSAARSTAILA
jgi:hypothetical protein